MKYFLVTLTFVTAVFGAKISQLNANSFEESQTRGILSSNSAIVSQNARVFNQEDQRFPERFVYPTYPEYSNSRHNGLMIPAPVEQQISSWSTAWTKLIPITSFALLYGAKAGIYLFSLLLTLIVGVVVTTSVCTFTPICTISFPALALTRNQVKEQVAELVQHYITPESLNVATILVQKAVDKYSDLQTEEDEKENTTDQPVSTMKPSS